ncbi:MAG TPA: hypothetical protein PLO23_04390 [Alphaproteobacteria bacterium]|nr:hypothetical protein [Alphaproteobacteria bacterium]
MNVLLEEWKAKAIKLIHDTPIEVAIGGGLLAFAFGVSAYLHEDSKRGFIPIAFSEIGQTKFQLTDLRGLKVPPLTMQYSVTNDVASMVFEASNMGYKWRVGKAFSRTNRIAYEMEKKVDRSMRIHTQIPEYAAQMEGIAAESQQSIARATAALATIKPIIVALNKAWDEDHDDVYRTEIYTETVCSSDGRGGTSCSPQVRTRQVYDHTIHTYTYDKQQGELAAVLLAEFMQKHPDIKIPEQLLLTHQTNAENEWAIRESRGHRPGASPLKGDDYVTLANTWATGSNYNVLMPVAYEAHGKLMDKAPQWQQAKAGARYHRYRTYSSSDSGPKEFRIAEAALDYARSMASNIGRTAGGIELARTGIPLLSQKIIQFVNAELHGGEGDPDALLDEIMELARDLYDQNFAGGFDTQPFKTGNIVLWTFFGLVLGGALGFGADQLIEQRRRLNAARRRDEQFSNDRS